MRGKAVLLSVSFALAAGIAAAQVPPRTTVDMTNVNCSGEVTSAKVPADNYIISGEQSLTKIDFSGNDLMYINRGADKGTNVGDKFRVIRPINDTLKQEWFRGQYQLLAAMGQPWEDIGIIRVVHVEPKTSTVQIAFPCEYFQRGDIIVPYQDRLAPTFKPNGALVDAFAPLTGKTGMIVATKYFGMSSGANTILYVNVGSAQGVQIGSYLRFYHYQGRGPDLLYQEPATQYKMYGFGSTPVEYAGDQLPREIVGEGIVVRVSEHTATVVITATRRAVYVGDLVEVE
jgi:hypothetical protein